MNFLATVLSVFLLLFSFHEARTKYEFEMTIIAHEEVNFEDDDYFEGDAYERVNLLIHMSKAFPDDPEVLGKLGDAFYDLHEYENALEYYTLSLEIAEDGDWIMRMHLMRGLCFHYLDRFEEALDDYATADEYLQALQTTLDRKLFFENRIAISFFTGDAKASLLQVSDAVDKYEECFQIYENAIDIDYEQVYLECVALSYERYLLFDEAEMVRQRMLDLPGD